MGNQINESLFNKYQLSLFFSFFFLFLLQTLDSLRQAVDSGSASNFSKILIQFGDQCKKGMGHRYLAGQKFAYPVVLEAWKLSEHDREALLNALYAMSSLTDGQPDLLESIGQDLLIQNLENYSQDAEVTLMAIRLTRHTCLKHEQNRQNLVKAGILRHLTGAISNHGADPDVVREACSALRIMTFDDDIRVPFGQAHDHAKMIVLENGGLKLLIEAAKGMHYIFCLCFRKKAESFIKEYLNPRSRIKYS